MTAGAHAAEARPGSRSGAPAGRVVLYVVLSVVALVFVVPLLWPIFRAFQPESVVTAPPSGEFFRHVTLDNFKALLGGQAQLLSHARNSAIVAGGTVIATSGVALLAGYGFGRFRFRGQSVIFLMILATLMIPFQALLTPLFLEFHMLHLTNNLYGLIVLYTTFNLPFGVFVMRNAFQQIPRDIEEASIVDGASTWRTLTSVMVPLVVPGLVTVAIYTFLFSWTEFLAALTFLTTNSRLTLPVALLGVESGVYGQVDFGLLEAGAVLSMIPSAAVYIALQRYYISGFLSGATKG